MAQFDVSFLNPKLRKSGSSYGRLIDQLDILQSKLEADGKLSPGDYDLLIEKGQELYSAPGMTPENRSNILVKMERYKSQKSSNGLKDAGNITNMTDNVRDDQIKATMIFSKSPSVLVKANMESTRNKLNQLSDAIDSGQAAGDNVSSYLIDYNETLQKFNDLADIQNAMTSYAKDGKPIPGYAAYITTNTRGEITDVKLAKAGDISGYAETNGLYGGLQIYGKPRKEGDKQVFKIGNSSFSAANIMVPDPANPGSFKTNQLTSDSQKTSAGRLTKATAGQYQDVDLNTVRSQTAVPPGSYAMGSKGFFYQAKDDGTYKKIVNATSEKLGISEDDILHLPKEMESSAIMPRVSETTDFSVAPVTPLPSTINADTPTPVTDASSTPPQAPAVAQGGTSRTPSPTERAPSGLGGYAKSALGAAKGFFGKLFGN